MTYFLMKKYRVYYWRETGNDCIDCETLDLFNILSKICIDKNERNTIIESIDKLYGKNAKIEGVSYFEKDSPYSFGEITGNSVEDMFGKKRRIDFYLHKSFVF